MPSAHHTDKAVGWLSCKLTHSAPSRTTAIWGPCRDTAESNRDPLHRWHWPDAPRGLVATIATGLFSLSHWDSSHSQRPLVPQTQHPGDKGSGHIFAMTLLCFQSRPQRVLSSASCPWPRTQSKLTSPTHWKDAINPEWKIPQNDSTWVAQPHSCRTGTLGQSCGAQRTSEQWMFSCMAREISAPHPQAGPAEAPPPRAPTLAAAATDVLSVFCL